MSALAAQFLTWYLVTQVVALAALPLTLRFFANLPDRGYAFERVTGILLSGIIFWLAYSYGLVRDESQRIVEAHPALLSDEVDARFGLASNDQAAAIN